jgi:hypothetical protein
MDALAQDDCADAYGQAVWSCPPDAGVNPRVKEPGETEANKPGTPGRSRSSRKAIAQGVPDVFRPYLSILCAFSFSAHKPAGAASARCSLRPRLSRGTTMMQSPDAKLRRGNANGCLKFELDVPRVTITSPRFAGRGRRPAPGEGHGTLSLRCCYFGFEDSHPIWTESRLDSPSPAPSARPLPARGER